MPAKNIVKNYRENAFYHLYNRGINKELLFKQPTDYKTFLYYLKLYLFPETNLQGETLKVSPSRKLKNYFGSVKLICYCLMPNHFHLLIYQNEIDGIYFFM